MNPGIGSGAVASGDITGDVEGQSVPKPEQFRKERKGEFFGEPAFVGTPDEVRAGLQDYLRRSPGSHLVLYMSMPGNHPKNTLRSMDQVISPTPQGRRVSSFTRDNSVRSQAGSP